MGDGSAHHSGLHLCINSYTIQDCVKLMNILIVKYQLDCSLHMKEGKYPMIYIKKHSMPHLQTIVLPYMDSSMLYKIQVNKTII